MTYQPKNFDNLLGTPGFSDQLLKNHFTLYQGYVTNVNKLSEELSALTQAGKIGSPAYSELKRRFGWEWNGMRLHELYFGNMAKARKEIDRNSLIFKKLIEQFGTYENWEKDFKGVGAMRGIGWIILYHDPVDDRLFNIWVNEHDMGHLAGSRPLLILDVFEHAYTLDYGIKKADYIEAFFKTINWQEVISRI